jgi:hypothetical protein
LQALLDIGNNMNLTDKDWLEKVSIAYKEYSRQVGPHLHIENFIAWMYRQYGIVQEKE